MGLTANLGAYGFIAAHLILSFMYYVAVRRGLKYQVFSECLIVLLIPVFGLAFMLAVKLRRWFRRGETENPAASPWKSSRITLGGNLQIETDIIPLNDALFLEDTREKRALLTNAIKQNVLDNGEILRKALRDPDREVSHYAVSMLTHQIEKAEAKLAALEESLLQSPADGALLQQCREAMKDYLAIDFLDKVTKRQNEERYAGLLQEMLDIGIREKALYDELIALAIKFGRLEEAERVCREFSEAFPRAEEPFIAYMSLYWERKDFAGLQDTIKALKASPIQLTVRSLKIIRFLDQGRNYV